MSADRDPSIAGAAPALSASAAAKAPDRAERQRIADAAQQFEAMFLLQMLKQMRQSMLGDDSVEPGLGAATMFDTIDSELATQLAKQGTGLAPVLLQGLTRSLPAAAPADGGLNAGAAAAAAAVLPAAGPSMLPSAGEAAPTDAAQPALAMPIGTTGRTGTVSSAFGWRRDPLDGSRRFHAGVDLRGAYGAPVAAAAGGRVVFAGERGGYGQSIVVEHAPGLQTRYAHLSEVDVREGDTVTAGAQIGRVGKSGRATGPHLHFEVLEHGRRVDPASGEGRLEAALKLQRTAADSPTGTPGTAYGTSGADE